MTALVEADVDVAQYAAAYPSVKVLGLSDFLGMLYQPGVPGNLLRAVDRADDARRLDELAQAALTRLDRPTPR